MSPARLSGMSAPLIPVLAVESVAPDPVAVSTWHVALSGTVGIEVGHDLLALWLFPSHGGVVLLGPGDLAQDQVPVPEPAPRLLQDQLFQLEEVLRHAKYESAIAVPVPGPKRDVGVLLLGRFRRGAYGPAQALWLRRLAHHLGPTLTALADVMAAVGTHAAVEPTMTREALPDHLARAVTEATSGPDLVARASGILYPLLPHDRLEILVPGSSEGAFAPLSGHLPRRRWSLGAGAVEPFAALVARFETEPTLLVEDLTEGEVNPGWTGGDGSGPSLPIHSIVGARLVVAGELAGYLLVGSVARDTYRAEDEETVLFAARLLGPRVVALRLAAAAQRPSREPDAGGPALMRAAEALAGTPHLGEALARFAEELAEVLPHSRLRYHVRWGDDEVVEVDPGSLRPLADLPKLPADAFAAPEVLRGQRPWSGCATEDGEALVVGLEVAGRPVGTLTVEGARFESARQAAATARQFANLLAPHLELLRRGAAVAAPGSRALARLHKQ